jgi:hypothetical protein
MVGQQCSTTESFTPCSPTCPSAGGR